MRPYVGNGEFYEAADHDLAAFDVIGWDVTDVPEPETYALKLMGLGGGGLGLAPPGAYNGLSAHLPRRPDASCRRRCHVRVQPRPGGGKGTPVPYLARCTLKKVFTLRTLASWVNRRCTSAW